MELGKAIQLCQLMETTARDQTKLGRKSAIEEGVAIVRSQKPKSQGNQQRDKGSNIRKSVFRAQRLGDHKSAKLMINVF